MNQQQPALTQQIAPSIAPIDPTLIIKSESSTGVILAVAILISILVGSITKLVRVIVMIKPPR